MASLLDQIHNNGNPEYQDDAFKSSKYALKGVAKTGRVTLSTLQRSNAGQNYQNAFMGQVQDANSAYQQQYAAVDPTASAGYQAGAGAQGQALAQYMGVMNGGPTAATNQYDASLKATQAQQQSLAASAQGTPYARAAAARFAGQQGAQVQAGGALAGQALAAQQQLAATQGFAGLANQMQTQNLQGAQMGESQAEYQQNLSLQQRAAQDAMRTNYLGMAQNVQQQQADLAKQLAFHNNQVELAKAGQSIQVDQSNAQLKNAYSDMFAGQAVGAGAGVLSAIGSMAGSGSGSTPSLSSDPTGGAKVSMSSSSYDPDDEELSYA